MKMWLKVKNNVYVFLKKMRLLCKFLNAKW